MIPVKKPRSSQGGEELNGSRKPGFALSGRVLGLSRVRADSLEEGVSEAVNGLARLFGPDCDVLRALGKTCRMGGHLHACHLLMLQAVILRETRDRGRVLFY